MAASGDVLGELIKAKENIKRNDNQDSKYFEADNSLAFDDWFKSYDIDKTYGPKIQTNGSVHLGKKEIKLVDNTLTIEDTSYPLTQGLGNLIFSKSPKLYTKNDLETYKSILIQTSAHLTADGTKIKRGGNKYSVMAASGDVLGELIKAKENIKRKYTALKHGKADIHSLVSETLSPIIEPLEKIKRFGPSTFQAQHTELGKDSDNQDSKYFESDNSLAFDDWFKSYDIDKTYGPKIQTNGSVHLGKKEIKLVDNTLTIEDTSYPLTQGLGNLIFSKSPKLYTKNDLETYKSILIQTSAHLTADGTKIKRGGNKYSGLIQNLFPSGAGLSVKLQKHNLVYWNDPNELVERLKLLLASKAAGNTGVSNEILSIFEELREAGLIKSIPNFAWAIALKSKTAKEVSCAMSKILHKRTPKLLQLDNGKEFYNSTFDALMKKHDIHKYSTYSTMKACIVERFNRTLKEKMFREFTARGSHEWISILPSLINEYNNSKHRTIGMTPVQADANPTSVEIMQRKIINRKNKFNVGDNVRISTYKSVFAKGYLPSWSTEIFKIVKINETLPTTYQLQDYTGKPIAGCFYSEEILKTNYPNDYLVEKIIQNSVSQATVMNVFGSSQSGETNKIISNLEQTVKSNWIFKHSKSMEDNKSRKTNKWLERNYHQLAVEFGDVEYEELGKILNSLKFTCIYVKGEQKKQVLMEYIPHVALINIEDVGCPRLDQICDDETLPCCIFHMEFNPKQCTFYKVFAIRKWFINNS
ncbi:hypothetical protein AGLY_013822 [Aphis glycines]|uniref:Integrase catalytic domain-containing protein n=1 Tax=Aphis glycines TaxID=307491 RepID=A0A6G0T563_APHGL|nr:hypothetical protein AGLY_013822 [Aphis glycines]